MCVCVCVCAARRSTLAIGVKAGIAESVDVLVCFVYHACALHSVELS